MKKISCIIPAYNEEEGIEGVLMAVTPLLGTYLHEIIVVDDGSKDKTKEIAKKFKSISLIEHMVNQGKSKTVADGIVASTGDYIFMLDADLKFLSGEDIINLIMPILNNVSDVTMSYIKNAWPLFPFKRIDYLTGNRILPKAYLMSTIEEMKLLPSYGLEVFINRITIKNKLTISVVIWPAVMNNLSPNKRGWLKGMMVNIKIWWNVLCTVSIFEMYYQNIALIRLLTKDQNTAPKVL